VSQGSTARCVSVACSATSPAITSAQHPPWVGGPGRRRPPGAPGARRRAALGGRARAGYGESLLERLSSDLTARFGRGFSRQNVQQMRQFYLLYPPDKIRQTASGKSPSTTIRRTSSSESSSALSTGLVGAPSFPLPWSHYVRLMSVENDYARSFYEAEALHGGWTVRHPLPRAGARVLRGDQGLEVRDISSVRCPDLNPEVPAHLEVALRCAVR